MRRVSPFEEEAVLTARGPLRVPTVADLVRALFAEAGELLRSEASVVKLEVQESLRAMLVTALKSIVAAGVALLGVLSLLAFLIVALGDLIGGRETRAAAYWASALVVGLVLAGAGGYLAVRFGREIGHEARLPKSQEALTSDRRMIRRELAKLREAARS